MDDMDVKEKAYELRKSVRITLNKLWSLNNGFSLLEKRIHENFEWQLIGVSEILHEIIHPGGCHKHEPFRECGCCKFYDSMED